MTDFLTPLVLALIAVAFSVTALALAVFLAIRFAVALRKGRPRSVATELHLLECELTAIARRTSTTNPRGRLAQREAARVLYIWHRINTLRDDVAG